MLEGRGARDEGQGARGRVECLPAAPGLPSAGLEELLGDTEQGVEAGVGPGEGLDPGGDFVGVPGVGQDVGYFAV